MKAPKNKRNHLIAVVAVTGLVLAGLWFGLVSRQQASLHLLWQKRKAAELKRDQMRRTIQNAARVEADLADSSKKVAEVEAGMASGDLYSWTINTIRQFKAPYKVEIPQFSQIDGPKDMPMFPSFPYQQATLTIGGSVYFYDFGRFLADFENRFPYFRILNLDLEPATSALPGDHEKLAFKMDISVLVKPNAS